MKKRTKTNPIIVIVVMVIFTALVIAAFFYLRDRAAKKSLSKKEKSEVNKLLSLDLEGNYPGNAREVLRLHNRFLKCYYNQEISDEELKGLATQNRKLFDKELADRNPVEEYAKSLKSDIKEYNEKKITIVNDKIQELSEAEREVKGGSNFCNLLVSYFLKEDKSHNTINEKYYLREDEKGHWKILFWEISKKTF